jgi:hypothetical protein
METTETSERKELPPLSPATGSPSSNLKSLLEKITPLPWELYGTTIFRGGKDRGANVATAGSPRASTSVGYTDLRCSDPDLEEAYRNAAYMHHAANALPAIVKLVEAMDCQCSPFIHNRHGIIPPYKCDRCKILAITEVKMENVGDEPPRKENHE